MGGCCENLGEQVHQGDLVRALGLDHCLRLLLEHGEEEGDQLVEGRAFGPVYLELEGLHDVLERGQA